jgi:formyl-CoA transferase
VVQNLTEVINDPQARSNGVVLETGSDDPDFQLTVGSPIQVAEEAKRPPGPAPAIGEHTMELLAELGISDAEVADLLKRRVVARDD